MRINPFKLVILILISGFLLLGFFAPFVELHDNSSTQNLTLSYAALLSGKSAELMGGSKYGALAAMSAAALLIALFLPNYVDNSWPARRVTVVSLCVALVFLASLVWPLMQAGVLIFGKSFVGQYGLSPLWGAYLMMYWGMGTLIFIVLSSIPAVRRSALGMD